MVDHDPALAKKIVTRMLTRDLFAVVNHIIVIPDGQISNVLTCA